MSLVTVLLLYLATAMSSLIPFFQNLTSSIFGTDMSSTSSAADGPPSQQQPRSGSSTSQPSNGVSSPNNLPNYEPTAMDVVVVKAMLQQGLNLPLEVILSIIDAAEYWPHTTVSTATFRTSFRVQSGRETENEFLLRSRPLGLIRKAHYDDSMYSLTKPRPEPFSDDDDAEFPLSQFQEWIGNPTNTIEHPCRRLVFTITSHDQGWGGTRHPNEPYNGSWTWFEAGLERFDKNATRPVDSRERDAALSATPATGNTDSPSIDELSEASSAVAVSSQPTEMDNKLPTPYLPTYSLRSIQPQLDAQQQHFHHPLHPQPDRTIQRNKTAHRDSTTHRVVWSWDDDVANPLTGEELKSLGRGEESGTGRFVRELKLGDVVTVWAKSRFGGWVNQVDSVKIDVYWAL
ncbi:hypothetical protein BD289DRAFT_442106 [Coniella lustricola]|uniref:Uncharacterized protein n=1 Tax=Coniella lustricola TaxID=2025994 RepID=A0A2T2ZYJ5_9PEZI|nr:hypothetical protein BD289DRAFT_442106 [Coniella lustricola]